MMTRKQQRLGLLALGMAALGGATALVLVAFNDNLVFFYSPSDLKAKAAAPDRRVRIGGLVEKESLSRSPDGRIISFRVTDGAADLAVVYEGLLPDLFREGQGVVAEGKLGADGVFAARTVLAKHDENYMPREVVEALKKLPRLPSPLRIPGTARKSRPLGEGSRAYLRNRLLDSRFRGNDDCRGYHDTQARVPAAGSAVRGSARHLLDRSDA